MVSQEVTDEPVYLAAGSSVTDGDSFEVLLAVQACETLDGFRTLFAVRINDVLREELAGFIDDGDLAADAETEHSDGTCGRDEQEIVELVTEDLMPSRSERCLGPRPKSLKVQQDGWREDSGVGYRLLDRSGWREGLGYGEVRPARDRLRLTAPSLLNRKLCIKLPLL